MKNSSRLEPYLQPRNGPTHENPRLHAARPVRPSRRSACPSSPPTLALVGGLNLALDRILPREPLEPLTGKRLLLKVTDAGLALRFTLTLRGFRPLFDSRQPDLTIPATTRDYSPWPPARKTRTPSSSAAAC